jgi:hypothetical protein
LNAVAVNGRWEPVLSKKMGRKFSSWSYTLQKAGVKIATYRPSSFLIAGVIIAGAIFLLGGGIYDILMWSQMNPYILLSSGRYLSYVPYQIHEQVLMGSIGVIILYILSTVGLLMIYQSTRYIRNPRQVSLLIKIGAGLMLISFVAIESVLYWIINFQ